MSIYYILITICLFPYEFITFDSSLYQIFMRLTLFLLKDPYDSFTNDVLYIRIMFIVLINDMFDFFIFIPNIVLSVLYSAGKK